MEMIDVMYELTATKSALEASDRMVRRLKGKCMRKNLMIASLVWFGFAACKLLGKAETERKHAEERARNLEAELAVADATKNMDKDVCCDGKASMTKKDV